MSSFIIELQTCHVAFKTCRAKSASENINSVLKFVLDFQNNVRSDEYPVSNGCNISCQPNLLSYFTLGLDEMNGWPGWENLLKQDRLLFRSVA